MSALRLVVETVQSDAVVRVERLECGHLKTTLTASDRPAKRRRCNECGRALVGDERSRPPAHTGGESDG